MYANNKRNNYGDRMDEFVMESYVKEDNESKHICIFHFEYKKVVIFSLITNSRNY